MAEKLSRFEYIDWEKFRKSEEYLTYIKLAIIFLLGSVDLNSQGRLPSQEKIDKILPCHDIQNLEQVCKKNWPKLSFSKFVKNAEGEYTKRLQAGTELYQQLLSMQKELGINIDDKSPIQ